MEINDRRCRGCCREGTSLRCDEARVARLGYGDAPSDYPGSRSGCRRQSLREGLWLQQGGAISGSASTAGEGTRSARQEWEPVALGGLDSKSRPQTGRSREWPVGLSHQRSALCIETQCRSQLVARHGDDDGLSRTRWSRLPISRWCRTVTWSKPDGRDSVPLRQVWKTTPGLCDSGTSAGQAMFHVKQLACWQAGVLFP